MKVRQKNIKNMRYKFKILDGDTGVMTETENMSYKKVLKSLVAINPKYNGAIYYTNKKNNYVCHSIDKGKKI